MTLAARARMDAETRRLERERNPHPFPPGQLQKRMAHEVGEIVGVEIDPYDVVDTYEQPYYIGRCHAGGLEWEGYFLSDSNGIHRIAIGYTVRRRVPRRFLPDRMIERRDVVRVGDLDGIFA